MVAELRGANVDLCAPQAHDLAHAMSRSGWLGASVRMVVPLHLDHVSLSVPNLREASVQLSSRLGLRSTPTSTDPDRHGRIYLDRAYLEVSSREPTDRWTFSLFFLRFGDPVYLIDQLESGGFPYRFGEYLGVDGRWDDVELDAGDVPFPILVRRTHPGKIARNWPPALEIPHRCGARTLEEVHVAVPDLEAAVDAYGRLLGGEVSMGIDAIGARQATFAPESGRIVLSKGRRPGISGIVLGVPSLAKTAEVVGIKPAARVLWINPAALQGLRIGFVEL
jgi:catechol 2,3-dioxygenase-like lactoylglutathione lyase family enzyme